MRSTTAAYDGWDLAAIPTEHNRNSPERPCALSNSPNRPAQAFRMVPMRHWVYARIINEIPSRYFADADHFWTAHIDSLGNLTGGFNFDCDAHPPRSRKAAMPDDSTADAPAPCPVHLIVAHLYINVCPGPPDPSINA